MLQPTVVLRGALLFLVHHGDGVHMNDDIHALERLTNRQFGFIGNLMGLDQRG